MNVIIGEDAARFVNQSGILPEIYPTFARTTGTNTMSVQCLRVRERC